MPEIKYRTARADEIGLLIELRKKQLIDEGIAPDKNIDSELYSFFSKTMAAGSLIEWLAEYDGKIVATAALVFYEFPPTYTNKSGRKAYITNMYTVPEYRRQGIAARLLEKLTQEAKKEGVTKLWLGASKLGRSVYKKFGFKETNEWLELNLE